ncbi:MAG TPA: GNAT family N-acetyltransferase [Propionicimonas sp.]|nr:GNAT family N-acetyltransferase [Propionicimonas sp.]
MPSRVPNGRIALLPLDHQMVRTRLERDDFTLERLIDAVHHDLHFGPEFPGEAVVMYEGFLLSTDEDGTVDGTYVVVDVEQGEAIGQVGLTSPVVNGRTEIGYGMNPSARNRGVATLAVARLLAILSARRDVIEVTARVAFSNPASARVLAKNGFTPAGRDPSESNLIIWDRTLRGVPE